MIKFHSIFLLFILFFPINIIGNTSIGFAIWAILLTIGCAFFLNNISLSKNELYFIIIPWILCASFLMIIAYSAILIGQFHATDSIFDICRPVLYILIFILGYSFYKSNNVSCYTENILFFSLFFMIVSILTNFYFRDFWDDIEVFYGKMSNATSGRFFAPFVNPYDLGLFLFLPLFISYYTSRYNIILTIFFILCILMTQSRSAVISLFFIAFLVSTTNILKLILTRKRSQFRVSAVLKTSATLFIFSLLVIFIFYYFDMSHTYLIGGFARIIEGNDNPMNIRLSQVTYVWGQLVNNTEYSWLLGHGIYKSVLEWVENEYLLIFIRYGFFSIVPLVVFFFWPIYISVKYIISEKNNTSLYPYAIFVIAFCFACLSNSFMSQIKLFYFYFFSVGLLFSHRYGKDIKRSCNEF